MDFQGISTAEYIDEYTFTKAFMRMFAEAMEEGGATADEMKPVAAFTDSMEQNTLGAMFHLMSGICKTASRPIVLMIDEVDSASNNQVLAPMSNQLVWGLCLVV